MTAKTDNLGLNKGARNLAAQEALTKANLPPPLDPKFPYNVVKFPASFFGVDRYSDAPPDKKD
jgi:hypothetical protein